MESGSVYNSTAGTINSVPRDDQYCAYMINSVPWDDQCSAYLIESAFGLSKMTRFLVYVQWKIDVRTELTNFKLPQAALALNK